jgi:hypothetical protein
MSYNLRYRSSRAEVWRWYWRAWRSRLWVTHLLFAGVVSMSAVQLQHLPFNAITLLLVFAAALPITILSFALWPQVAFKNQERVLSVGPDGWSTTIGDRTGSKRWSEISSVQAAPDSIVITSSSGNALVIPDRAFLSPGAVQQFLKDAQAWHLGHAV